MFAGKSIRSRERLVPVLPIETGRLEAESIQKSVLAAAAARLLLGGSQELRTISPSAQILSDPKQVYVEVAPERAAEEAGYDSVIGILEEDRDRLLIVVADRGGVVLFYALTQQTDALVRAVVINYQTMFDDVAPPYLKVAWPRPSRGSGAHLRSDVV